MSAPFTSNEKIDGPRVAPASGRDARSIVILVHGYGSNGADLIGLAPYWRDALADTVFVAPNAPEPCPGAPGGYQWWPVWNSDRAAGVRGAAGILAGFGDGEHFVGGEIGGMTGTRPLGEGAIVAHVAT